MKAINRRILVVPTVFLSFAQTYVDPWNHNKPLLSVVIPCCNYGRYIRETLRSLESQTFRDFETIVVDDGSNEELTLRVLDNLRNEGIEVLRQEKLNVATALNLGIGTARGRYVCCLAADDTLESSYFEKALCLLESNPGVAFAYSLVKIFGDESRIWRTEPFDLRLLLDYNYICAAALFRKSSWEKVGGFDQSMDGYEDWDFWLKVGEAGFRGRLISEPLFNYRRHGATLNVRSDRKYQKLTQHIKASHSELYSNLELIAEIQRNYRDVRVPEPFLNLNSKVQYRNSSQTQGVILVSSHDSQITDFFMPGIKTEDRSKDTSQFAVIITDHVSLMQDTPKRDISDQAYHLERFVDPYSWFDFVVNLISTRSVRLVAISSSILAYGWAPTIKSHTSAFVVNVIRDPKFLDMSVKYDAFIDLHVVFSEDVMNSLTNDFGVRCEKIRFFSKSQLTSMAHELLTALMTHGKQSNPI
jgi:glycosyltransferase involved in cell wall biosynthesis